VTSIAGIAGTRPDLITENCRRDNASPTDPAAAPRRAPRDRRRRARAARRGTAGGHVDRRRVEPGGSPTVPNTPRVAFPVARSNWAPGPGVVVGAVDEDGQLWTADPAQDVTEPPPSGAPGVKIPATGCPQLTTAARGCPETAM